MGFIHRWLLNEKALCTGLATNPEQAWPAIERIWRKARFVYEGRSGPAAIVPLELRLVRTIVSIRTTTILNLLQRSLTHRSPRVAAYAVLSISEAYPNYLSSLSSSLFERTESIECKTGCFFHSESLGAFARRLKEDGVGSMNTNLSCSEGGEIALSDPKHESR
jgi:hypothetical protein